MIRMKTLKWMMLFMAVATMPLFTNCSKDDDDKHQLMSVAFTPEK